MSENHGHLLSFIFLVAGCTVLYVVMKRGTPSGIITGPGDTSGECKCKKKAELFAPQNPMGGFGYANQRIVTLHSSGVGFDA